MTTERTEEERPTTRGPTRSTTTPGWTWRARSRAGSPAGPRSGPRAARPAARPLPVAGGPPATPAPAERIPTTATRRPWTTPSAGSSASRAGRPSCGCTGCSRAGRRSSGKEVGQHVTPESFADGRLVVRTDSTAWATQMKLLAADVVRRLNEVLGEETVQRDRRRRTPRTLVEARAAAGQGTGPARHLRLRLSRAAHPRGWALNALSTVWGVERPPETGCAGPVPGL